MATPLIRVLACIILLTVGMLAVPTTATADPLTRTDRNYLASLHHGGLCCPNQTDVPNPILRATTSDVIDVGHTIGKAMSANPTYDNFRKLQYAVQMGADKNGIYLNSHQTGQVVIIATHHYGGAAAECSLMKAMGGAMGEAPYWYGPVTYSGGLAVQPGCIDLSR